MHDVGSPAGPDGEPADIVVVYLGPPRTGGTAHAIERHTQEWVEDGLNVCLLTYDNPHLDDSATAPNFTLGPPPATGSLEQSGWRMMGQAARIFSYVRRVRMVVRQHPGAVVLAFLAGSALVTLTATTGLPNRVIACERIDVSLHRNGWHARLLRRLLYPHAAAITVNSTNPAAAELLRRVSRGRPVHVVPNPRPRGIPRADPTRSRIILAVGRLVVQKQHVVLIDAFAVITGQFPEWRVVILGEGPLRNELEAHIQRLGLCDRVTLVGQVDDPRHFYTSAGMFVLPSDYEGTSNALLEAATAGLPCIVSRSSAPDEYSDALRLFPPGDSAALAAHLRALCTNPGARQTLGEEARHWANHAMPNVPNGSWESVLRPTKTR